MKAITIIALGAAVLSFGCNRGNADPNAPDEEPMTPASRYREPSEPAREPPAPEPSPAQEPANTEPPPFLEPVPRFDAPRGRSDLNSGSFVDESGNTIVQPSPSPAEPSVPEAP